MATYFVFDDDSLNEENLLTIDQLAVDMHKSVHDFAFVHLNRNFDSPDDLFICKKTPSVSEKFLMSMKPIISFVMTDKSENLWNNFYKPVYESFRDLKASQHSFYDEISNGIDCLTYNIECNDSEEEFEDFDIPSIRGLDKAFNYLESSFEEDLNEFLSKKFNVKKLNFINTHSVDEFLDGHLALQE